MTYFLSLKSVAVTLGIAYSLASLPGIFSPERIRDLGRRLPRNVPAGIAMTAVAATWFSLLMFTIDLAEFTSFREVIVATAAALAVCTCIFLQPFLLGRALGCLMLLGAEVLLSAAFPVETPWRYLVTLLAYVWVVAGMILVTLPYKLRDLIDWSTESVERLRNLSFAKLALGLALLIAGFLVYP